MSKRTKPAGRSTTDVETAEGTAQGSARATTGKQPPGSRTLTAEQRAMVLAMLAEQPDASDTVIANASSTSRATVYRLRQEIAADNGTNAAPQVETTEELGRALAKALPLKQRVSAWKRLATGRIDPRLAFAMKAALQRVDEYLGHVTRKEAKEAELSAAPGPIFVFPAGMMPSAAPLTTDSRSADEPAKPGNVH